MIKQELNSILKDLDREAILSIAMMSILVSILTLSIPVTAQILINVIAFGKLLQPVFTLSIIVLALMLALGTLHVWQAIIIKVMQQKLMVKITINLTTHFTKLSFENFSKHNGSELVNRFFEIITIKKSLASLLLYGVNLGLQLFFGLLLLVFYHPLFIIFDLFLLISISLIIIMPYRQGLESAKKECEHKHQVGDWLEELLINRFLFRFSNYQDYAIAQADKRLVYFLNSSNAHFTQLIKHQIGFYLLAALSSSILLGLGGYLVINNQLSLGQLVAAEMVLGALIYTFNRFSILLENYYDLIVSTHKIEDVLNLPIEEINNDLGNLFIPIKTIKIKTPHEKQAIVSLEKPLLIYSNQAEICKTFTEAFLGFRKKNEYEMDIWINDTIFSAQHRPLLRQYSLLLRDHEWFAGSIYDNLLLNTRNISNKLIMEKLNYFGLAEKILQQPEGLNTVIYDWQTIFTELELFELMLIRAVLLEPQLLVIDRILDHITQEKVEIFLETMLSLKNTIVLITTQNPKITSIKNRLTLS
jgi:ABC-type bacteriocin/lantibiotic exporter with double-glycine peptidase domain